MLTKLFLNSLASVIRRNGYFVYNTAAFTNNYIRISDKFECKLTNSATTAL